MRSGARIAVQEELYIKEEVEGTSWEREWQLDNTNKIYCYLQLGSSVLGKLAGQMCGRLWGVLSSTLSSSFWQLTLQ